ncbi:hypothetical protein EYZ11_004307 [Aspergillus tanneri]|uniref:Zn(2)-C6 fungal-type domain-containing protein n=1 Tax=Aspergillus tanneri TaxID=1220188 RepID=A0A4S3JKV4_9EURO|nr:uncharacterized protein ATNIH1004_003699 [Aspergillus tanneri]KAA8651008.1 hypothetical protein ATNIH1004_003699 [Aspergillus tanneri]THC96229.1 hypothetical protein EYZ11_004307 [Aspergillus tanneri]
MDPLLSDYIFNPYALNDLAPPPEYTEGNLPDLFFFHTLLSNEPLQLPEGQAFPALPTESSRLSAAPFPQNDIILPNHAVNPTKFQEECRPRQPRRQNHTCDQCRFSKKACRLPPNVTIYNKKPSTSCSTCKIRGLECTVAWLAGKRSSLLDKKRANAVSYLPKHGEKDNLPDHGIVDRCEKTPDRKLLDVLESVCTTDADLTRKVTAREVGVQQFNLYVDVYDLPLSECLFHGCMPPSYSLGVAAWVPLRKNLQLSSYWDTATAWIKGCWDLDAVSTGVAPYIFRTASVLDALFQPRVTSQRNVSITETYRWAAIAIAAQFATTAPTPEGNPLSHDIAVAAWQKAKTMVFGNISAVRSFRIALSLFIFGCILPPPSSATRDAPQEDAIYARAEGLRRLQTLCARARVSVTTADHLRDLPNETMDQIGELIGATEWLTTIVHSVTVSTMRGSNCGSPEQLLLLHELEDSVITRAQTIRQPFTTRWCHGLADDDFIAMLRLSGSVVVLLWKSLADLTVAWEAERAPVNYGEVHQRYEAAVSLIEIWRATFGALDEMMKGALQQLRGELWRMVSLCSNDANLPILLFCDVAQRIEFDLERLPNPEGEEGLVALLEALQSTRSYRKQQRLASATQVSIVASTCYGVSRPGFQGTGGLKASIMDIGSHPDPSLLAQAYTLAARAFTEEVNESMQEMDMDRASQMTSGLETCLQALRGLQDSLVTFPGRLNRE